MLFDQLFHALGPHIGRDARNLRRGEPRLHLEHDLFHNFFGHIGRHLQELLYVHGDDLAFRPLADFFLFRFSIAPGPGFVCARLCRRVLLRDELFHRHAEKARQRHEGLNVGSA